jgi:hypothetical protein
MKRRRQSKEASLYPIVDRWMKRHFLCFRTAINKGLRFSRIDVIGIRDMGCDLASDVEAIAIEVKRGTEPFATACGQTLGYRVYAHRVYLADYRDASFSPDEVSIASSLGIGLIQIRKRKCTEILSSPIYRPMPKLYYQLLERLALGRCQFCDNIFQIGDQKRWYGNVTRENIKKAIADGKGIIFWNSEISNRKAKLGIRSDKFIWERRFICPDCVERVISQLGQNGE